uniref:Uncharacterized protein n=1 Tax=Rhizophora mucronata TaxID=61149 RepID=A0A2P2PTT1_RHIMU
MTISCLEDNKLPEVQRPGISDRKIFWTKKTHQCWILEQIIKYSISQNIVY